MLRALLACVSARNRGLAAWPALLTLQPQRQARAGSQQTSPMRVLNIWMRQEVETSYPYLIDGKTKTENCNSMAMVIQLIKRTAKKRSAVIYHETPSILLHALFSQTLIFFFLFQRTSISRSILKGFVLISNHETEVEKVLMGVIQPPCPEFLCSLPQMVSRTRAPIHSFIQRAVTDAWTPTTPTHSCAKNQTQ